MCISGSEGGGWGLASRVCRRRADCWESAGSLLSQTPALLPTSPHALRTSGVFPASAVAQGSQLLVHSVDRMVNTTFICTATNAVGTGRAEQVILVRGKGAACSWV